MEVVITDNKTCYSYYDSEHKILHSNFKGIVNLDLFKEHTLNVLSFTKENQILAGLIDFRKLRGSFLKILGHLEGKVQPKLQARGFNIQAFIVSDDIITTAVTEKLYDLFRSHDGNVKIFSDPDDAKKWVVEMINS
jgi:hypothetical protein